MTWLTLLAYSLPIIAFFFCCCGTTCEFCDGDATDDYQIDFAGSLTSASCSPCGFIGTFFVSRPLTGIFDFLGFGGCKYDYPIAGGVGCATQVDLQLSIRFDSPNYKIGVRFMYNTGFGNIALARWEKNYGATKPDCQLTAEDLPFVAESGGYCNTFSTVTCALTAL